ncbi:MAG: hypothetical protein K2K29_06460 [Muribaculaceae bacterium]|nr:hypothetical protein [Muribaculaceae bacterium]
MELRTEEFSDSFSDMTRDAGEDTEFVADCVIESDLELRLPPEYVPQESERISLYQRLDNMEKVEDTERFAEHLRDRFGEIPLTASELIKVVPLRITARRLGIERLTLKGGKMYLYFVGDDNKAYYQSPAFGRVLTYLQQNFRRAALREIKGKRSLLIDGVDTVSEALTILTQIQSLTPAK